MPTSQNAAELFGDRDLVFFDPDNGIERSIPIGRRGSSKYIYWNEIVATFESGASILVYQHFPREKRESFTTKLLDELRCRTKSVYVHAWSASHVIFLAAFHGEFSLPERLMKPSCDYVVGDPVPTEAGREYLELLTTSPR